MQAVIIDTDGFCESILYSIRGEFRAVKAPFQINRFICTGVNTHTQANAVSGEGIITYLGEGCCHERFIVFPVGAVEHKGVCFQPAGNSAG